MAPPFSMDGDFGNYRLFHWPPMGGCYYPIPVPFFNDGLPIMMNRLPEGYPVFRSVTQPTTESLVLGALAENEQPTKYVKCMKLQQKAMEQAISQTRHLLIDHKQVFIGAGLANAKGGYGQVWRCSLSRTRSEPQQEVAVKRIHLRPEDAPSKRRLLRHLLREVVPWHGLNHLNITPFIGYTFDGNFAQLISQWEPMGNLRQNMPNSPSGGLCIARQVSSGLAYLHSRSEPIIHGDIKPENILIGVNGIAKLVDFGLSVILDDNMNIGLRSSDGCRNTPLYADPTLIDDQPRTLLTDIWALAWVIYEVLTQRMPYDHVKSRNAKFFAIARYDTPKPSTHYVPYTWNIWPVLETSWSKDQSRRWSAERIASHLSKVPLQSFNPPWLCQPCIV